MSEINFQQDTNHILLSENQIQNVNNLQTNHGEALETAPQNINQQGDNNNTDQLQQNHNPADAQNNPQQLPPLEAQILGISATADGFYDLLSLTQDQTIMFKKSEFLKQLQPEFQDKFPTVENITTIVHEKGLSKGNQEQTLKLLNSCFMRLQSMVDQVNSGIQEVVSIVKFLKRGKRQKNSIQILSNNRDSNLELRLFKSLFSFKIVYEKQSVIKDLRTVSSLVKESYFNSDQQAISKTQKFDQRTLLHYLKMYYYKIRQVNSNAIVESISPFKLQQQSSDDTGEMLQLANITEEDNNKNILSLFSISAQILQIGVICFFAFQRNTLPFLKWMMFGPVLFLVVLLVNHFWVALRKNQSLVKYHNLVVAINICANLLSVSIGIALLASEYFGKANQDSIIGQDILVSFMTYGMMFFFMINNLVTA